MELPLTPLEFARRTRKLYPEREAVIDGDLRFTYEQFFSRCDRWSNALLSLGVKQGDRVAYIAPNTHAMLESFYAIPQIGAICVPINYRLTPKDFVYLINHSGARVVCVHSEYLDAVESIRSELSGVTAFVALEDVRDGWLDYETLLHDAGSDFIPA
ncbi:MAG TPA: AMP-binding protein, partial [Pyrinomonadaceae bacterium]